MDEQVSQVLAEHGHAFERYYELLVEWNKRVNLTAIVGREDVYTKHFLDSLLVAGLTEWSQLVGANGRVLDVGTGAGFPGLPLSICFPRMDFVLCDSLQKRLAFIETVVTELGLENVTLVHGRAEDLGRNPAHRNRYDAVVSRAVARLNVLAELTLPLARVGGYVVAYKGPGVEEEVADGSRAAARLGGVVVRTEEFSLPDGRGQRTLVVLRQARATPKTYPRKAGTPQRQPL